MSFKEKKSSITLFQKKNNDFTGDNDISLNITQLPISGAEKKKYFLIYSPRNQFHALSSDKLLLAAVQFSVDCVIRERRKIDENEGDRKIANPLIKIACLQS